MKLHPVIIPGSFWALIRSIGLFLFDLYTEIMVLSFVVKHFVVNSLYT